MNRIVIALLLAPLAALEPLQAASAIHAENYEEARARAKVSGGDIVVFQRGSDWNRLSETLYRNVWLKDEFARELGDGFVLVAVDRPETIGTDTPSSRLASLVDVKMPLPANEVMAVESEGKVPFAARADGAFLGKMKPNPDKDTLTLKLKTKRGGRVLRLDFPPDPSLPDGGPGRGGKGNFAISEIVVRDARKTLTIDAAWASASEGDWGAWQAVDGIADKPDNAWNPGIRKHQHRTLLLTLAEALPVGADVSVQLICRSQWKQHVPGCVRAAVLTDASVEADVRTGANTQRVAVRNAKFSWWDTTICPRIALLDSQGRAVACENKPRLGLTPKTMAELVKKLRSKREQRDALWAKAEQANGPAKAELFRQSLDLLGFANWEGNDKCYKPIHDKMREADPNDESGAVRWLTFGGDPRDGLKWAEPSWSKALEKKDLTDEDFKEALARIDKELQDPRNKVLDHERIQRIMVAKYLVYSRWPKHEEQRFDVQREIAAFDPDTFWGIGARGELGLHHRSVTPMLTYGWGANQVKPGLNTWNMNDTAYFFDHAGPYKVRLTFTGGKDALLVRRVALLDGTAVLSEAKPGAGIGPTNAAVEVDLDFKDPRADRKVTLRVEAEAADGHTDIAGSFDVEPQLLPAPAIARQPAATDEVSRMLERGTIRALQQRLDNSLLAEAAQGVTGVGHVVNAPSLQASLAQSALLRLCGVEKVESIAAREGGAIFLQSFFKDTNWLDSFLASDKADWPQALENLYLLRRYGAGWEQPLNQRLATALALQWGNGSRYRLVDRFRHIQQAWRDGLMHSNFENLNVREMRWAVPTYGTATDFQFLLDDRQTRWRDYLGAHGGVRYVSYNVYGVTVQDGWNYIGPWAHVYGNGTGNRPFPAHKQVGGVCGTVSTYGSAAAQVHGIPSTAIGQPGHCAYIIQVGQEWPVGNSVTWPSHASAPGWDGTGYSTLHRLYEPVNQDRARFMTATRLGWLAQLQADRARTRVNILPGLRYSLYRHGTGPALPDFTKLKPVKSGTCPAIDLAAVKPVPSENFGVVWEGQIEVTGQGALLVSTQSDDGSRVLIDGAAVVAANCSRQEKAITVTPGRHQLRVEFCQGVGALNLTVGVEGMRPATATDWMKTYEQALLAQPTNYGTWLDYIKTLETVKDAPSAMWLDLGQRAAHALASCNEAGWALTRRCLDKVLPEMKPAERMALLLKCNQQLRQENWYKPEVFPYDDILNWQAERISDPALAVEFFGKLLAIHHSDKPDSNFIFGNVLSWGANRFAGNAKTAPGYAKAMETFFRAQGQTVDKNLLATTLQTGVRKASQSGDIVSFRLWTDMATKMLPSLTPGDVHLNPKQAAAFPKFAPFPGDLLSKDGMLQTSSANPDDRPLSYRQVLSGGFGGWFDTDKDDKPYAQVQLAGEGELTGVVLVNRYEYAPTHEAFQKPVPLKVSISTDGKTWTEVASFDKPETVFRVDLQGRKLQARYVRAERLPKPNEPKPLERFYLRGFLVYGKKSY